jgi:hypothetical protein
MIVILYFCQKYLNNQVIFIRLKIFKFNQNQASAHLNLKNFVILSFNLSCSQSGLIIITFSFYAKKPWS